MKLFKIMMLFLAGAFMVPGAGAQIIPQAAANASINVLTANSGQVKLGQTVFLQVDVSNTGPNSIQAYRVKVQVAAPTALVSINNVTTVLPSGWTITGGGGVTGAINLSNGTDVIPNGETRTVQIALVGTTLGTAQTVSGQLSFSNGNAPGTAPGSLLGNSSADDNSTSTIQVIPAPPCTIAVTATAGNINCNGGTTTLTATATGANGAVEYSLNGGAYQPGKTFTVNAAGSPYTITAREGANPACTATTTLVTVTQPAALVASASAGIIKCSGGTTTLTVKASGGTKVYQYSLNGGSFQAGNTFIVNGTGSPYIVTVKDAHSCITTTAAVPVTQPKTIVITPVITSDGNGTIAITATGGTGAKTYVITAGTVINTTGAISGVFTGLAAGTYTFAATDSNGCTSTSGPIALKIPPSVSLITPANYATYLSGKNVDLGAIASDADGKVIKVEFYNGNTLLYTAIDTPYTFKWEHVPAGNYVITAKATDNDSLVTTSDSVNVIVLPNRPPTVTIISPSNGQTFIKGATVHLQATAADADGSVTKVAFYNGTTLLATNTGAPYSFDWKIQQPGYYTVTAKATDNGGAVTTSAARNISVLSNRPPMVSLTSPSNGQTFTAPATINIKAAAQDVDGKIVQVSVYNGTTLLTDTVRNAPYQYTWKNVSAGTYTITAVAKDNWSAETTSAPVTVTVASPPALLVSNSPSSANNTTDINKEISLLLAPNPVRNILNINTTGLQQNKQSVISVISSSGVIFQTKQLNSTMATGSDNYRIAQTIQLNVSSLARGMYIIKIISGDKVMYKQFVKM